MCDFGATNTYEAKLHIALIIITKHGLFNRPHDLVIKSISPWRSPRPRRGAAAVRSCAAPASALPPCAPQGISASDVWRLALGLVQRLSRNPWNSRHEMKPRLKPLLGDFQCKSATRISERVRDSRTSSNPQIRLPSMAFSLPS